jgi:hypothetical protein
MLYIPQDKERQQHLRTHSSRLPNQTEEDTLDDQEVDGQKLTKAYLEVTMIMTTTYI